MEAQVLAQAKHFLQGKGYPPDALLVDVRIPGPAHLRPDILIVDPESREHLAIIELEEGVPDAARVAVVSAILSHYLAAIKEPPLETYLFASQSLPEEPATRILLVRRIDTENAQLFPVDLEDFPRYSTLVANRLAGRRTSLEKASRGETRRFTKLCYILAAFSLVLFGLDSLFAVTERPAFLSLERLILLGVALALFVLPHTAKFKFLSLDWERLIESEKRPDRDTT